MYPDARRKVVRMLAEIAAPRGRLSVVEFSRLVVPMLYGHVVGRSRGTTGSANASTGSVAGEAARRLRGPEEVIAGGSGRSAVDGGPARASLDYRGPGIVRVIQSSSRHPKRFGVPASCGDEVPNPARSQIRWNR